MINQRLVAKWLCYLMMSDHLGDVHETILIMCNDSDLPKPQGDFLDGWGEDYHRMNKFSEGEIETL